MPLIHEEGSPIKKRSSGNEAFKESRRYSSYTCPNCGASIGLNEPRSFRLVLTDKIRTLFNGYLIDSRNFLRGLDAYLAQLSHRTELYDIFGTPYWRDEYIALCDDGWTEKATWKDLTGKEDPPEQQDTEPAANANEVFSLNGEVEGDITEAEAKERLRERINVYGVYSPKSAIAVWADFFHRELDTHDFARNFGDFPRIDSEECSSEPQVAAQKFAKLLLGPALERRNHALLVNLIEEQKPYLDFRQSGKLAKHSATIKKLVGMLRPELAKYIDIIEQQIEQFGDDASKVRANIERAYFLMLIVHGHGFRMLKEQQCKEITQALGEDAGAFGCLFLEQIYSFPDDTVISEDLFAEMLKSRMLLSGKDRDVGDAMPTWIKNAYRRITQVFFKRFKPNRWLGFIDVFVRVQCVNEIEADRVLTTIGEPAADVPAAPNELGWMDRILPWRLKPKKLETARVFVPCRYTLSDAADYSLVLLGSPGAGKTTLYEAGLAKLWRIAERLGFDLVPTDKESTKLINDIQEDYFVGRIKDPTEFNLTLNFEASRLEAPDKRVRFSVIDVPGEKVLADMAGSGTNAELRRLLRHANTIVFLFDMWSDKNTLMQLHAANASHFKSQIDLARLVEKEREKKKGYFTNQRLLLSHLIAMLKSECSEETRKAMNFVCLFPKIDALVDLQKKQDHLIFSEMMRGLRDDKVLIRGRRPEGSKADGESVPFSEFESLAGLGVADLGALSAKYLGEKKAKLNTRSEFQSQIAFCQGVSLQTKTAFDLMGKMLPSIVPEATQQVLAARVCDGVIRQIEAEFDSSFFLPVSALGRSPTAAEMEKEKRTVEHPNSVFAEYAFLLPLFAAFEESFPS